MLEPKLGKNLNGNKSKNQINDHFFGCKTELSIGVENEKFLFRSQS